MSGHLVFGRVRLHWRPLVVVAISKLLSGARFSSSSNERLSLSLSLTFRMRRVHLRLSLMANQRLAQARTRSSCSSNRRVARSIVAKSAPLSCRRALHFGRLFFLFRSLKLKQAKVFFHLVGSKFCQFNWLTVQLEASQPASRLCSKFGPISNGSLRPAGRPALICIEHFAR